MCDGKQIKKSKKLPRQVLKNNKEPANIGSNHVMWFFDSVLSCNIHLWGFFIFKNSKIKEPQFYIKN
jgi:hypothetical protein